HCGRRGVGRARERAVSLGAVSAGDGDVELGVAPHTVLVHVEPAGLDLWIDADAPRQLERQEDQERRAERERTHGDEPERLDAELVQAPTVEEALRAGRQTLR